METQNRPGLRVIIDEIEYKPKPKPLLADAKVGDLCKTDLDEWIQIDGTSEPPSPFQYYFDRPFKGNIIHTEPLAPEGSAEWAVQRMKLGDKVTKRHLSHIYWQYDARPHLKCISEYNCGTLQIRSLPTMWLITASPIGWQIYKEPKPEPAKEPEIVAHKQHANCLVCGKEIEGLLDGHATVSIKRYSISSLYESTYSHYCGKCFLELGFDATERELRNRQQPIAEPEPAKEQFKVGDWVEVQGKQCEITNSSVAGETPITGIGIDIYGTTHIFKIEDITRKLEFNEVVVDFPGIRPGTVEAISDECFALKSEYGVAIIMFNMLYARQFHLIKKLLGVKH